MDPRLFATVFVSIFLASASALVLASAIGVLAGGWLSQHVSERMMRWVAGAGFVAIGAWILWSAD